MKNIIVLAIQLLICKFNFAQNLILNPGFENGLTNWTNTSPIPSLTQFSIDNAVFHSGSASAKITSNLTFTDAAGYLQIPNLEENKIYECSYWVKSNALEKYLFSFIQFKDSNDNDITQIANPIFDGQGNWEHIKFRFKVPENANKAILAIFIMNTGTVWLDDVSLIELTDTTYQNFTVDIQSNTGSFKKLLGVNTGPVNPFGLQDYTNKFNDIGIDFVRTHDYHVGFDFHVIFPDMTLSPDDPLAYDFSNTDALIADIINADCEVFFRLGESAGGNYNSPPLDNEKWAQVALHIIKHYNDNWNDGFAYDIKYWEIWNEPDLHEFWTGSLQEYIELYETAANTIKTYDSTLSVGGPTLAIAYDTKWINTFLAYVSQNNIPLDFFSYHNYDLFNPYNLSTVTNYVKQKLLSYNLNNTELILDEWNPYPYNNLPSNYGKNDALNAASTVSGLHYLQNSPIDKLFRYSTDALDFPLFNWDNTYTYQGFAYKAIGNLIKMDNSIETSGGDLLGTTIDAGKSVIGNESVILIADNSSSSNGYNLNINGINSNEVWDYEITRLDSDNKYISLKTGTVTSTSNLISENVSPPFVDQITLSLNSTAGSISHEITNKINVFPNPFENQLTISATNERINMLIIYNNLGQVILKESFVSSLIIDTSILPTGLFFYEFSNDYGEIMTGKIVKK